MGGVTPEIYPRKASRTSMFVFEIHLFLCAQEKRMFGHIEDELEELIG